MREKTIDTLPPVTPATYNLNLGIENVATSRFNFVILAKYHSPSNGYFGGISST